MRLPSPRGPLSTALFAALRDERTFPRVAGAGEDDRQISLWALYELHYRGFDDVDPAMEWNPAALTVRAALEESFEADLRRQARLLLDQIDSTADVVTQLEQITATPGPSVAKYLHREADENQYLEFLAMRSLYHLKEADPHTWALPRLTGRAKAALVEIQYDEYGGGDPEKIHQRLYADALTEVGLDSTYGAYVDETPAHTLAVNNAMSLFGLHRRLRGASVGHLAAFEMTSSIPCRRFAQGAARLGLGAAVVGYFDEHVEADAVHEHIASRNLCGSLVEDHPELAPDVLLGAATCVLLDIAVADEVIASWTAGLSALRTEAPAAAAS